jgi:hypothetical protein
MTEQSPLDSAEAIDLHLDRSVSPPERARTAVRFVLCDAGARVRVHCVVGGLPPQPDEQDCAVAVSVFATAVAEAGADGAMLVVLTRPGPSAITDQERRWFHAAHRCCARAGVRLLGVHLMTPTTQRRIALDDAL